MTIVSWRPVGQNLERWDEMNRMFEGFFGRSMPGIERAWSPAVDMFETKDDLVVTVELPGMSEKDIQISITGEMLSLRGERVSQAKEDGLYRGERWYGKFERNLTLPYPVQTDKVKATYRDGVLTITLPKAEELKPRAIKIDVA
jgi:HSP20 family protein